MKIRLVGEIEGRWEEILKWSRKKSYKRCICLRVNSMWENNIRGIRVSDARVENKCWWKRN